MRMIYTDIDEIKKGDYVARDSYEYLNTGKKLYQIYYKVVLKKSDTIVLERIGDNRKKSNKGGYSNYRIVENYNITNANLYPITKEKIMVELI